MYQKTKNPYPTARTLKETPSIPKQRKIRKDKKKDIKVPVSEKQKKAIRRLAYKRKMTATSFSTMLVEEALQSAYLQQLKAVPYKDTHDFVHVKLRNNEYDQIVELAIDWNVSVRKCVYRILVFMLADGVDGKDE